LFAIGPRGCDLEGLEGIELDEAARQWGLFDSTTFDRGFTADIARAQKSIVVFSGFVSHLRVGELEGAFDQAIQNNVKIRCVTRPPTKNFPKNPASGAKAFDVLEKIACVVDGRSRVHQKVIIIDERIVWNGSLNALSFARGTDELMMRAVSRELARATALMLAKLPIPLEKALEEASKAENPRCDRCGGRMFYEETLGGSIYFECEQRCGWRKAISASRRAARPRSRKTNGNDTPVSAQASPDAQPHPTPISYLDTATRPYRQWGPPCPQCHSETRLRYNSQTETHFYGCSRFHADRCRGTLNIPAEYPRGHS
jgi:ssDNA-binding Zn-finger/Zn-ribbon topoisomerase 1